MNGFFRVYPFSCAFQQRGEKRFLDLRRAVLGYLTPIQKSRQNNETAISSRPKQALVLVSLLVLFAVVRDRE